MKKLITISAFAALTTSSLLGADVEAKISEMEAKIKKLENQLAETKETLTEVKKHDGNDNIKWDVDFRTAIDNIHYTTAKGNKASNPDLLTNRLWLGMGFAPDDNTLFKGKLSYMKAYGDSMNHSQANTQPGYANFDWVTNENATDNTVKVKEAYWLYKDTVGENVPYTVSIGRRPSTDGLGINLREGMKENSPLSHTVNVEFDGLSAKFDLDKVTGVKGMWWKLCTGRGLTNAKPRFSMDGQDYAASQTSDGASHTKDVNMYGFIFVPYDNGQYSVWTNWAKAEHMIGFTNSELGAFKTAIATATTPSAQMDAYANLAFKDVGDLTLFTAMFKAEGVGEGISDYLDDTKLFVSWAQSTTNPNDASKASIGGGMTEGGMLGSINSETGTSTWIGVNMPCLLTKDGRIGIEWNKGSKYWRGVTYGEDTMTGSKIAARGTAIEAYYNKPINKALSFNLRYTKIKYDYTGSNGFFGADGTPMTMAQAILAGQDPVEKATDLRASISYRF